MQLSACARVRVCTIYSCTTYTVIHTTHNKMSAEQKSFSKQIFHGYNDECIRIESQAFDQIEKGESRGLITFSLTISLNFSFSANAILYASL